MSKFRIEQTGKWVYVLCLIFVSAAQALGITIGELRQIVNADTQSVRTAHLVYTERHSESAPQSGDPNTLEYALRQINSQTDTMWDVILDYDSEATKSVLTDLRDVDALLKKNKLDPKQKINISRTKTLVTKGDCEMELVGQKISLRPGQR